MRRSIRGRLQVWYALVLLTVVAGFAGLLFARVRDARFQEVDGRLEAIIHYLDVNLRRFPPHELDKSRPDEPPFPPPPPPDGKEKMRPRRPPPRIRDPERLLEDLTLPRGAEALLGDDPSRDTYFAIWRADGSLLKANGLPSEVSPPQLSGLPDLPQSYLRQRGNCREAVMIGPFQTRILVGQPVAREQAALIAFAWQLAGIGVVALAVGLAGGWVVSNRIFRPIAAITATASAISATNLSQRLDADRVDRELEEMARVLNAMFDRLEAAFERQARFTADASHELRTPLAIIRTHAELALSRPRSNEEYKETITTCLRASSRMTGLVDGLLTLARADAGKLDLVRKNVDWKHAVEESIALLRPLAEEKKVTLSADLEPAVVTGDNIRLAQVVTNLVSNAVQYNHSGGEIRVRLRVMAGETILSVQDTGCGIPEEDQPHIFERFYRVDKARSRASGGNGLGLAICKSIVDTHGGTIGFETKLHTGSTFWVRLPTPVAESRE